jgi:hypothetical protein
MTYKSIDIYIYVYQASLTSQTNFTSDAMTGNLERMNNETNLWSITLSGCNRAHHVSGSQVEPSVWMAYGP